MKETERKNIEHTCYAIGLSLLGMMIFLYLLYNMLPISLSKLQTPCMFYTITGLYCPGCGGTRAVRCLLKGQFIRSFLYHPIVLYSAGIYLWFMVSHTIEKLSRGRWNIGMHYRNIYLWIALGIVLIQVLIKDIALICFHIDIFIVI